MTAQRTETVAYLEHTHLHLQASGGAVLFFCDGGPFLIGPADERWNAAMLVRQNRLTDFLAFSSNEVYLAGMGHRIAALGDSQLLPLVENRQDAGHES